MDMVSPDERLVELVRYHAALLSSGIYGVGLFVFVCAFNQHLTSRIAIRN